MILAGISLDTIPKDGIAVESLSPPDQTVYLNECLFYLYIDAYIQFRGYLSPQDFRMYNFKSRK